MPRFVVSYSPRSTQDLQSAYEWGVENWGRQEADTWLRKMDELIVKRLSFIPLACSLAPESSEYDFDLRQLIVHRYRVLFTVFKNDVFVLRIRGPFSGDKLDLE